MSNTTSDPADRLATEADSLRAEAESLRKEGKQREADSLLDLLAEEGLL